MLFVISVNDLYENAFGLTSKFADYAEIVGDVDSENGCLTPHMMQTS